MPNILTVFCFSRWLSDIVCPSWLRQKGNKNKKMHALHGQLRHINPDYINQVADTELADFEKWSRVQPGSAIVERKATDVFRVPLKDGSLIFKRYKHAHTPWRYFLRPSRAASEWRGLSLLASAGIRVPELVGYGEDRQFGKLIYGYMITKEVSGTMNLEQYAVERWAGLSYQEKAQEIESIRSCLFKIVHRMHKNSIYHRDLFWRNILIKKIKKGKVRLWLIDCPRLTQTRFENKHHRMVDLSCLARAALSLMSKGQRYGSLLSFLDYDKGLTRELFIEIEKHHRRSKHPPKIYDPRGGYDFLH